MRATKGDVWKTQPGACMRCRNWEKRQALRQLRKLHKENVLSISWLQFLINLKMPKLLNILLAETLGKAMGDDGFQRVQSRDGPMLEDSWAAKHLLGVCLKNKLSNDAMGEILQVLGTLIDFSILQSRKKVKTDPQLYNLQLQRAFMW